MKFRLLIDLCCLLYLYALCFFFFFFQAEDGIRDTSVTGVQTCALPICTSLKPCLIEEAYEVLEAIETGNPDQLEEELGDLLFQVVFHARIAEEAGRSEERRVGKECRCRWARER